MKITLNGKPCETPAGTLAEVLAHSGYGGATVATAVNGSFVPAGARGATPLTDGDRVEVVAPRQGG